MLFKLMFFHKRTENFAFCFMICGGFGIQYFSLTYISQNSLLYLVFVNMGHQRDSCRFEAWKWRRAIDSIHILKFECCLICYYGAAARCAIVLPSLRSSFIFFESWAKSGCLALWWKAWATEVTPPHHHQCQKQKKQVSVSPSSWVLSCACGCQPVFDLSLFIAVFSSKLIAQKFPTVV